MPYLIVGLGNIGPRYQGTRHNIGFHIVDLLASTIGATFSPARYGDVAKGRIKNAELILLKPSTFINLSGKAVRYYLQAHKLSPQQLLVVVDDLALPLGTIRLKPSGGDAGHNGLKNITELLGSNNYARLRIGIGNDFPRGGQIDFVLGTFTPEEEATLPIISQAAIATVQDFALVGIERAMNWHNKSVLPLKQSATTQVKPEEGNSVSSTNS